MTNFSKTDLHQIDCYLADIRAKRSVILDSKASINKQIAETNILINKSHDKELSKHLTGKLFKLKLEFVECSNAIRKINEEVSKYNLMKEGVRMELNKTKSNPIFEYLTSLKEKYMEFSSDTTRVSSMRIMASKFAEELDFLISRK